MLLRADRVIVSTLCSYRPASTDACIASGVQPIVFASYRLKVSPSIVTIH
jgi:hypothetical protein